MPQVRTASRHIPADALERFAAELLRAARLRADDALLVARSLVDANLRGIDSHGIARLPHYLRRIEQGSICPQPCISTRRVSPATALVEGDHGLGQLVMQRATEEAIELARSSGAGWAAVKESSHCGALAFFGEQIAQAGMIGLVFTHVDSLVLPHGSKRPFCGTNPICIAAPRVANPDGRHPPDGRDAPSDGRSEAVCLDMATSRVPWNTVANAAMEGVPIEPGWAVDAAGCETQRAEDVAALYPMGDYKGSGLGLMIDVLCALLSDAPYGPDIPSMYADLGQRRQLGGLVGAIDIQRFLPLEHFCRRLDELVTRWGQLPPVEPNKKVLYPGEPEQISRRERHTTGIPIGLQLLDEFTELAAAYHSTPLPSGDARRGSPPAPHIGRVTRQPKEAAE